MTIAPTNKEAFFMGTVRAFLGNTLYYPEELRQKYGELFYMKIPTYNPLFIFDPKSIRYVLEKNHLNYKKSVDYKAIEHAVGKGLLTNEGASWKSNRKLIQPYFYKETMDVFIETMKAESNALLRHWSQKKAPFPINKDIKETTLKIASELFFGINISEIEFDLTELVDHMNELIIKKMRLPYNKISIKVPLPLHLKIKKSVAILDNLVYKLINASETDLKKQKNLLSLLVLNPHLSPKQVRDEILTFTVAGYETTANTLQFLLALLAKHPEKQEKVSAEIRSVNLDEHSYMDWFKKLPYTHAVIQETLRLYPPAWMLGRQALKDDCINGIDIKKGTNILIDSFLIHRHPDYWKDPELFIPERFIQTPIPEAFTYLPFGAGSRVCIGQQFAKIEIILLLYTLFKNHKIEAVDINIEPLPLVTLTPKHDFWIELKMV